MIMQIALSNKRIIFVSEKLFQKTEMYRFINIHYNSNKALSATIKLIEARRTLS